MADPLPERPDPLIGTRVNGFVILRKLAEGGMGAVYLAEHALLTHIHKVIKVLLPEYAQHPQLRLRFEREADVASRMKHDNIVKIDEFGTLADGQLFLMTELLEGQPLDEFLRAHGGRLAEHRALLILLQLCSALEHLHQAGIVHRDLKPGNVFVCPTKKQPFGIKLLDFGVAKLLGGNDDGVLTQSGSAVGTPSYMAVEQYEYADEATPRADIYAVGIMTCEMVTGRLPWGFHEQSVLYFKQRTERPHLEGLSPGWAEIVRAALEVAPRDRPESARAYAVALASATPALGPHVPSGAEMLCTVAPELAQNAPPDDETVRNQANRALLAPQSWSTLIAPQATTIGASAGVMVTVTQPRGKRWKLAIVSLAICGVAGTVTLLLAHERREAPSNSPRTELRPVATAVPSTPSTVPVDAAIDDPVRVAIPAPAIDAAAGQVGEAVPIGAQEAPVAPAAQVSPPNARKPPSSTPPPVGRQISPPGTPKPPSSTRPGPSARVQSLPPVRAGGSNAPTTDRDAFDPNNPTGQ